MSNTLMLTIRCLQAIAVFGSIGAFGVGAGLLTLLR